MDINYKNNPSLVETNHLIKPSDIPGFSCNRTAPISASVASNWFVFSAIIKCKKKGKLPNANGWTSSGEEPRDVFRPGKQKLLKRFPEVRNEMWTPPGADPGDGIQIQMTSGSYMGRNPLQEHFSDSVPTSPLCSPLQACVLAGNLPPRVLLTSQHCYICFKPRLSSS